MKRHVLVVAAVLVAASAAHTADAPKPITVAQALNLLVALRNLDGHLVVAKQNGSEGTVMVPWEFGSGALRLAIAHDIDVLTPNEKIVTDTRKAIFKEVAKGASPGTNEFKPGTPEAEDFARQFQDAMTAPAVGASELTHIKAADLKLDKNEIPVTVLSALKPILDQ
jgi:hypothetical protein